MLEKNAGYKQLVIYQVSLDFIHLVYLLTNKLPKQEFYGLSSQMRRASVSVISNFVEGYLKKSRAEKDVYLERSINSLFEVDCQADVCLRLGFLNQSDLNQFSHLRHRLGFLLYRYRAKVTPKRLT